MGNTLTRDNGLINNYNSQNQGKYALQSDLATTNNNLTSNASSLLTTISAIDDLRKNLNNDMDLFLPSVKNISIQKINDDIIIDIVTHDLLEHTKTFIYFLKEKEKSNILIYFHSTKQRIS